MDIEGLGDGRISCSPISDCSPRVPDTFTADTLDGLEGFGPLSIANLLGAIDDSRNRPLHRVLIGLGIRHLGQVGSIALARAVGDIDAVISADEASLAITAGVGPVIAASVVRWFASEANRSVIERLRSAGVTLIEPSTGPSDEGSELPQTLEGKSVVVTGTLEGWDARSGGRGDSGPGRQVAGHRVEEDLRVGGG